MNRSTRTLVVLLLSLVVAAGASMLAAFVLFAAKVSLADWRPGEFLHLGLAIGLGFFARWLTTLKPPQVLPASE